MKNAGKYDPTDNPLVMGGLSPSEQQTMLDEGWQQAVTAWDVDKVLLGFKDDTSPSGYTVKPVDIPAGIPYLFNPKNGEAVMSSCGNPTCWRWLV